jgi:N-acyl-D-amino-acid deacylase
MEFDRVIREGQVVDGTGRARYRADIGILGGRIAVISAREPLAGREVLDAAGRVVAPGFIDVHSHAEWVLPLEDHPRILAPLLEQGITTLVTGNCGFSPAPVTDRSVPILDDFSEMLRAGTFPYRWRSVSEFLNVLEGNGVLLNTAFLAGHGTLRYAVMGKRGGAPEPEEMESLSRLARKALEQGAFGVSAGLAYAPGVFSRNEELRVLLRQVAEAGGLFTVHGRAYTWASPFYRPLLLGPPHNLRSVRELIRLAHETGVRLQLSHQIFVGRRTWRTHRAVLREIERAADSGLDVALDAFPYTVGNSTVSVVFPEWFLEGFQRNVNDPRALARLRRESRVFLWILGFGFRDIRLLWGAVPELEPLEGLDFAAMARRLGMTEFETYMHVARLSGGKARILLGTYSGDEEGHEGPLRAVLSHPLCAFMTDTILTGRGRNNPASFGAFPRVLGQYSRDRKLFPLEEAVRRMTSFPAERVGLKGVGRVEEGGWADLVIFDPETVRDNTTPDRVEARPAGIHAVVLSGHVVVRDGKAVPGERRGRVLRR